MIDALHTPICERLGITYPIFGLSHSVEAAAAITNAGGFGVYAGTRDTPEEIAANLKRLRELTGPRPFGVDLLLPAIDVKTSDRATVEASIPPEHRAFIDHLRKKYAIPKATRPGFRSRQVRSEELWEAQIRAVLDADVAMFATGTGCPPKVIERMKAAGKFTVALIGAPKHAKAALAARVDMLVAQGYDAGGHTGVIGTFALVPQIVELAGNIPVIAAGGIGTGGQVVASLAMGAQGAWLGTLWLATAEQHTNDILLKKLLAAGSEDTVITRASSGKTMRQLRTAWSEEWASDEAPKPLKMPYQDILVGDLLGAVEEHRIEPLVHEAAGQSVVWCRELSTVKAVVDRLVAEARASLAQLHRLSI